MTELGELAQVGEESMQGDRGSRVGSPRALEALRALPGWAVFLGSAVAFWVVGFLPWIVEGMHFDGSSWARFDSILGPVVALPFGTDAFQALLVGGVIGGTAALGLSRLAAPGVWRPRILAAAGALTALLVAVVQTTSAVRPGLDPTTEARLLLGASVVAAVGSGLLGVLVGAGVARGAGWPWLLGGAVATSLVGPWLIDLVARHPVSDPMWLMRIAGWLPWIGAIALGVVLAVFGLRPASRLLGWVVALAIAWVTPSALTALFHLTDSFRRGPLRRDQVLEILDASRDVFVQSLSPSAHVIGPYGTAVVVGMVGSVLLLSRGKQAVSRP